MSATEGMTRRERHEYRLLESHPDELTASEFSERRSLMQKRRAALVGEELRRLRPVDRTRRHRRNALHPNARRA